MDYNLFIDDIRNPNWNECVESGIDQNLIWLVVRSSKEAKDMVMLRGMPTRLALDHDLGIAYHPTDNIDTVMKFLNWLARHYWKPGMRIPDYTVHSANPVGVKNIKAFMDSWKWSEE